MPKELILLILASLIPLCNLKSHY